MALEFRLRRTLHALGLRFRVQICVLSGPRRVADVVSLDPQSFVDDYFWHGCQEHTTGPKSNADFWRARILANRDRQENTNMRLSADGWEVIWIWAHERPQRAAARIMDVLGSRRQLKRSQ